MDDLDKYFDAYAENALDDDQLAALRAWLDADKSHVDRFVRDAFLHWQLAAIGSRKILQAEASDTPASGTLRSLKAAVASPEADRRGPTRQQPAPSRWRILAAAALMLSAGVLLWSVFRRPSVEMVAQLSKASANVVWSSAVAPQPGTFLPAGQHLEVKRGRLLTTLTSGVQLVVEGPARLKLTSDKSVFLTEGRMTVVIPRQASGFVVDSPLGQFVDLGTDYTIKLDRTGFELHVFSGLVEMRPRTGASDEGPFRIPEGRAIKYDAASGKPTNLPYQEEERISL
jgi:ferric-dicitrate binding protein FerR (iron transport regulator)